jgi:hypothetical protein
LGDPSRRAVVVIVLAQLPAAHDAAAQSGDRCLTAADQAEISRLEKEIAGLREQRKALDAQYSRDSTRYEEARERDKREGWPAGQGSSATHAAYKAWTTSLYKLGAADKAIAADEQKLAALRALPPCAPGKPAQPVTTPAPVPPTGTPAPVPPTGTPTVTTETPCPPDPREAQLEKELAQIDVQLKRVGIALDSDNEAYTRRLRQLQKLLNFPPSFLEGKGSIKEREPWLAALREDETYQRIVEVVKRDWEEYNRLNKKDTYGCSES